jgi:type IV secretory pathway VirB10-like protein
MQVGTFTIMGAGGSDKSMSGVGTSSGMYGYDTTGSASGQSHTSTWLIAGGTGLAVVATAVGVSIWRHSKNKSEPLGVKPTNNFSAVPPSSKESEGDVLHVRDADKRQEPTAPMLYGEQNVASMKPSTSHEMKPKKNPYEGADASVDDAKLTRIKQAASFDDEYRQFQELTAREQKDYIIHLLITRSSNISDALTIYEHAYVLAKGDFSDDLESVIREWKMTKSNVHFPSYPLGPEEYKTLSLNKT